MANNMDNVKDLISHGGTFLYAYGCQVCFIGPKNDRGDVERNPHCVGVSNHSCKPNAVKFYVRKSQQLGSWVLIRERRRDSSMKEVCSVRNCGFGVKCQKPHSEEELHVWRVLLTNGLFVRQFLNMLLNPDEGQGASDLQAEVQNPNAGRNVVSPPNGPRVAQRRVQNRWAGNHRAAALSRNSPRRNFNSGNTERLKRVLEDCQGGRFLLVCQDCYNVDPRVILEMLLGRRTRCPWCNSRSELLLHETLERNAEGIVFHEYQPVRKRLSDSRGNKYCKHLHSCYRGEQCKFVHSIYEQAVWEIESWNLSRLELVHYCRDLTAEAEPTRFGVFHCSYCSLNFHKYKEYSKHLKCDLHLQMEKKRKKDIVWKYRKCPVPEPAICESNSCYGGWLCPNAHFEEELQEWRQRKSYAVTRNEFSLEEPTASYLERLQKRIQEEELLECENALGEDSNKSMQITEKHANWTFRILDKFKLTLQHIAFLQPIFKLKHTSEAVYRQHLAIREISSERMEFDAEFTNPKVYGHYNGTLVFDFGEEERLRLMNFNVTIRGSDLTIPQLEILNQDWSANRVVIKYPDATSHEPGFENKIKELELQYRIPQKETLDDVSLDNLSPSNYAKRMHTFLYKEEVARQTLLSRLNIECELTISSTISLSRGGMRNAQGDYLFARFTSPSRLSADSDEGVLVRDSCSMVLIGAKESTAFAYECKIEAWEHDEVYIILPARCISELDLSLNEQRCLVVQYKLDRRIFCQRHYAVDILKDRVSLICPSKKHCAEIRYPDQPYIMKQLDNSQNMVLKHMQAKKCMPRTSQEDKCFPPLVVAGPFGTGKTHTIRNVILHLLEANVRDSRILLCTHANSAADLYIKDIFDDPGWQRWKSSILRVMYHGRKTSTVLGPEVLDFCLLHSDNMSFRYPSMSEVRKYRLIITTFPVALALGALGTGLHANAFSHIFLDEASQAMEPEVIMPLTLASAQNTRIIIAGDHRQINERLYLPNNVRIPTLLERMYDAYEDVNPECRLILNNNYRCVDGLLQLISELFYKEKILNKTGNVQRIYGLEPVQFVHVQGECQATESGEFLNGSEAEQILYCLQELVKVVKPKDIVVTAPYYQQVMLLREILKRNRLRNVSVYPARNLQALQYKVVILSCVLRRLSCLSCVGENFGFLSDPNLLNTVLTRAKSLVITVGDAVTLCSTGRCKKKWKTFIKHCEETHTIHPPHINVESIRNEIRVAESGKLDPSAKEFVPTHLKKQKTSPELPPPLSQTGDDEDDDDTQEKEDNEEEYESDTDSWISDIADDSIESDTILNDMVKKAMGHDPNKLKVDVDEQGREKLMFDTDSDEEDPSDPNELNSAPPRRRRKQHEPIFPKHSIKELEEFMIRHPKTYIKCRIRIKNWFTATAVPVELDGQTSENDEGDHVIHLNTKINVGRTFDNDEVVVKILEDKHGASPDRKVFGKVMGVLKRHENPRHRYFLCRPAEDRCGIMSPIDMKMSNFAIVTPENHVRTSPPTIPVYQLRRRRKDQYAALKLMNQAKVDWNNAYAIRYLKWSEYCPYPLGYVEKVVPIADHQQCLALEFGIPTFHRPSLVEHAKKLKIPTNMGLDPVNVITIDPEGSKDLDDALSFEKCTEHENCSLIGVHITDVASVLPKDHQIDRAARKQKSSFYTKEKTSHMLPEHLSTDKCSILQGRERAALSTYFHSSLKPPHIDEYHAIKPQKTFIKSFRQLTYRQTEDLLKEAIDNKGKNGEKTLGDYIHNIWQVMWGWRVARLDGAAFYNDRGFTEVVDEGRAHLLIEEAMLAVNANAAKYLTSMGFNIPLRVQEPPELGRWLAWKKRNIDTIGNSPYLSSYSEHFPKVKEREMRFTRDHDGQGDPYGLEEAVQSLTVFADQPTDADKRIRIFKRIWEDMMGCKEKGDMVTFLFLTAYDDLHPSQIPMLEQYRFLQNKSMSVFANVKNHQYHYTLRIPKYVKSSSPIRRYTDIVIQRCIHRALQGLNLGEDLERLIAKINWDFEDRIRKFEQRFELAELARSLGEQPEVFEVCISMITDAYIKIHFPMHRMLLSSNAKQLDYSDLMIDMESKDLLEGKNEAEIRRTEHGDIILDEVDVFWKFRYYNYAQGQQLHKVAKKLNVEKFENATVTVPVKLWRNLIDIIREPPKMHESDEIRRIFDENVENAVKELTCQVDRSVRSDRMCGETRNNPVPLYHHREIRSKLSAGLAVQVQLSSWSGKDRLPEPCIQLLSVSKDVDVCVHHNREPLHVFAYDARTIKDHENIDSLRQYQRVWEPLIRLDAAYNSVRDGASLTVDKIQIIWDAGTAKANSGQGNDQNPSRAMQRSIPSEDAENFFALNYAYCRERYIDFHCNSLLCLRLKNVAAASDSEDGQSRIFTAVIHGIITHIEDGEEDTTEDKSPDIKVFFRIFDQYQNLPYFGHLRQSHNLWTIEVLPLDYMHKHMHDSLRMLSGAESTVIEQICLRAVEPGAVVEIPEKAKRLVNAIGLVGFPYPLNELQQQQKKRAVLSPFTVIQGPPGTGKSFMGAQIAATFAYINKLKDPEKPKKVLYCGPSNKSVDVAAGFLKMVSKLKVVRMYSTTLEEKLFPNPMKPGRALQNPGEDSKTPDENLRGISLHNLIRGDENPMAAEIKEFDSLVKDPKSTFTRKEVDAYVANLKEAKRYELEKADIIVCTCSLSTMLTQFMDKKENPLQFGQCIIDECGMCSEPETIMPLVASAPEQVVLIGDHMQLQPVIKCRKAERLGLGTSLFSKYSRIAGMLTKQYRMHPTIMSFPSEQFYEGKLHCADTIHKRPFKRFFPQHPSDECVFWHVVGEEHVQQFKSIHGGEKSKYNMAEANLVVQLLVYLTNNAPNSSRMPPSSIMVLSPYTAQCARIREKILKEHSQLKDVHVGTVVTSQGSEADYVILSTVRSLPDTAIGMDTNIIWQHKNLGFLCDPHQVNVALTRARHGLCIIGNKNLLRTNSLWEDLIRSYEVRQAVLDHLL